jgi:hypothetical protein
VGGQHAHRAPGGGNVIRDRIEAMGRSVELDEALAARIADPLWLLARQWMVGEFQGDDAAQPVVAHLVAGSARLASVQTGDGSWRPLDPGKLLEAEVEHAVPGRRGTSAMLEAARLGVRAVDAVAVVSVAAAEALAAAFPMADDGRAAALRGTAKAAADLFARRAVDGTALLATPPADLRAALDGIDEATIAAVEAVLAEWRPDDVADAWSPSRMEHTFRVRASTDEGPLTLVASEHDGGHLDWYSFDVEATGTPRSRGSKVGSRSLDRTEVHVLPSPARYAGMPASCWWEFEDGSVHFGNLANGPDDLASMAVGEFATVYGDDWFVVPLRLPAGTVSRVLRLEVVDTFGRRTRVGPTSLLDDAASSSEERAFRLFELDGDLHVERGRAPWLLLPPVAVGAQRGPALEHVELARDEGANLAWAVERLIEGPLGAAIDRGELWYATRTTTTEETPADGWRWRLETDVPPWWIPLVPQRVAAGSAETALRRGRMAGWDSLARDEVGPKGLVLEPDQPLSIAEEEVTRSGVQIERSWQLARERDGSVRVWLQRHRRNGRGERHSGLRWDVIDS